MHNLILSVEWERYEMVKGRMVVTYEYIQKKKSV